MSEPFADQARGLLPGYLTANLPGAGGRLRVQLEDFRVEEIPAYGPTGEGQHTLFEIEKRGLSTMQAIQSLARAWQIAPQDIGSAGLKDARAVARQMLSVEGVAPAAVLATQAPHVRILWAERHRNRLKIGHLRGNRFIVRVRDVGPEALERARAILDVLERRGVPNGFGPQRFGARQNTHELGACLVRRDIAGFYRLYLGCPQPGDSAAAQQARGLFEAGDWAGALAAWPQRGSDEYRALATLVATQDVNLAWPRFPLMLKRLFAGAWQSFLFNRLLAARLDEIDRLEPGDLAVKHANGAFFRVDDPAVEQPRADRLEISASGPLYGYKVRLAEGRPGELERRLLAEQGLSLESWRGVGGGNLEGARRPFRVPLADTHLTHDAEGLVLWFALPAGAYATNVLAEVTKSDERLDLAEEEPV